MSEDRVVLPSFVVPEKYDIKIWTNLKEPFEFKGEVEITIDLKEVTKELVLHSKQLKIESCQIQCKGSSAIKAKDISFQEELETVTFSFEEELSVGKCTAFIKYTGSHNNEMAGFYRSGYKNKNNEDSVMISTQFEPLDARRCFPCVDEPAAKATFLCSLVVDDGLVALGNMPVKRKKQITKGPDAGRYLIMFEESPRMSTYLVAFCVGEFDYVETTTKHDVLLRVYTPPNKAKSGDFALEVGSVVLDLYDDMFGKPFPLPKMDMIAIPEFAMGAMENWGLVTYREVDLLIDPATASSQQKQRVATVVAHELAHQWFGNLVTMEWWDDLWLNEGFASWMQDFAVDKMYPDWKLWEQFIVGAQADALSLDALESSHPIQVPIKHAKEVEEVFDLISYRKGSCVVRLVHAFLGHDMFVEGLKLYMDRHQYGNSLTHNLWDAWEEVSKKPINKVMNSWTEQMGYPLISVDSCTISGSTATIKVSQRWFLADGSIPEEKRWSIPMFVTTEKEEASPLKLFSDSEDEFSFEVGESGWFKLNGGQFVPLRVLYSEEQWKALGEAVKEGKLGCEDRAALVLDANALVKAGLLNPGILLEFLLCFKGETSYAVWSAIAGSLEGIRSVLFDDKSLCDKFVEFGKSLILPAFEKVGWEEQEDDGHLGKMLRALLINLVSNFAGSDEDVVSASKKMFDAFLADPQTKKLPSGYATQVFKIVLKNSAGNTEYDALFEMIDKLETTVEKKRIYLALGYAKSLDLKLRTMEWAASDNIKLQDFFYPIVSVSRSSPEGLDITWNYLKENFSHFKKKLENASPSLMGALITYSASGFTSMEKADEIAAFFEENPTTMTRKVEQLVEATRNRAKYKDIILASEDVRRFLAK